MNAHTTKQALYVGQPVDGIYHPGWIASVEPLGEGLQSFTLSGGMRPNRYSVTVVWDNGTHSADLSEHIVQPWADRAGHMDAKSAEDVAAMLAEAKESQRRQQEERQREQEEQRARVDAWQDSIRDKIPADAKAVLIAVREIDDCDTMTDYFNTKTGEMVILGFSRHTRDLFPEMRKAAARYDATAHLADAGPDAEHREKYSMGAGFYLKASHRYSSGWKVEKRPLHMRGNDPAAALPYGKWAVPEGQPFVTGTAPNTERTAPMSETPDDLPAETVNGCTICPRTHTKKGFRMWIVCLPERVDRDEFARLLQTAKGARGWYSRKWGDSPAGFAFKDADAAREFAEAV
jgi:hypothetical protein